MGSHKFLTKQAIPPQSNETNLSSYNYETADWKSIKEKLKMIKWSEELEKYRTAEEKLRVFLKVVIEIVDENCTKFKCQRGTHENKIPRDRRILLRKKRKMKSKLECDDISVNRKSCIEKTIGDIDNQLLRSHKREKSNNEARAVENIKS